MQRAPLLLVVVLVSAGCGAAGAYGFDDSGVIDSPLRDVGTVDRPGQTGMDGSTAPDGRIVDGRTVDGRTTDAPSTHDAAVADSGTTPPSYALPPPDQCDNQFFVSGCQNGVASSACGGICSAANACENLAQKPNADIGFICPRFALASADMTQAAIDDFGAAPPFSYAVAGHDPDTGNGLDGSAKSSCCQCYQLVFDLPEQEAQVGGNGASAIPIPPPMIVQAMNTSAGGGQNFDLFMGAGGFGAFNACDPKFTSMPSPSGHYLYSTFPEDGEPSLGGENAATHLAGCRDGQNLVTTASLSSDQCVTNIANACSEFSSSTLDQQSVDDSIQSCLQSNDVEDYTHLNWQIYAKKVECPTHLTEVTGCKLAPQGLPSANASVRTPAQAAADPTFKSISSNGQHYSTTTMQDCCKPSCAWQDYVTGPNAGLTVVGGYNSFYTCDQTGAPVTQ